MDEKKKGLIIVYTGPGKGKTTASLGAAFRAVGQGLKVLMVQFIKGSWHYGELDSAKMLGEDKIKLLPMGRGFVKVGAGKPDPEDVRLVEQAWEFSSEKMRSSEYDLVIRDRITYAIIYKMLDPDRVVEALRQKPEMGHVILTGRNAHPKIVEMADLVTEMREVKHPDQKGIEAPRAHDYADACPANRGPCPAKTKRNMGAHGSRITDHEPWLGSSERKRASSSRRRPKTAGFAPRECGRSATAASRLSGKRISKPT